MKFFKWPILLVLVAVSFGASQKKAKSLLPPGYALMPGKDSLHSFLIMQNPVSNFDYLLYQKWIQYCFMDYPEMYRYTMVNGYDSAVSNPFNDPGISSYLGHPAYTNYPVLGVNWLQAMEYCSWKTDRMNEAILKSMMGIDHVSNSDFVSEHNFNTEAFLNGQYWFSKNQQKNERYFEGTPNRNYLPYDRNDASKYPFLLWGGRLPTEEEWDYYQAAGIKDVQVFPEASVLGYAEFFKLNPDMITNYKQRSGKYYSGNTDGFYEWTLDVYSGEKKHYGSADAIFHRNNFFISKIDYYLDQYGAVKEKDSIGRLGFRIMGWRPGGDPLMVNSSLLGYQTYKFNTALKDTAFIAKLMNKYREHKVDSFRKVVYNPYAYYTSWYYSQNSYSVIIDDIRYYVPFIRKFESIDTDSVYLLNEAVITYWTIDQCYGCDLEKESERTIKSTKQRDKLRQSRGAANTGFRMVFPYYGNALPEPIGW